MPDFGWLLRSLLAGLLLGLGSRVLMRYCWEPLSPPATGFCAGATSPPGLPGRARGLLVLLVLAIVPPPSARSAVLSTPLSGWLVLVSFGGLFLHWGLLLEFLWPRSAESHRVNQPAT